MQWSDDTTLPSGGQSLRPTESPARGAPANTGGIATRSIEASVGNLKGVGRIYQQTFIDTYSKVSFAKLYDRKTPITSRQPICSMTVCCHSSSSTMSSSCAC
jgi:hypothetical protein